MAYKIFADTNVYLDFLMQRGKDWTYAKEIFKLAEDGLIEVYTSSSSMINIMYVMNSYKLGRQQIIDNTNALLSFSKLVNPDNTAFEIALASEFKDMEDAVQYYTALEVKSISYFITSNLKDYIKALPYLPVITPKSFMEVHHK